MSIMRGFIRKVQLKIPEKVFLRIGVSCGPAVAGVIGLHKPKFDVWGGILFLFLFLMYFCRISFYLFKILYKKHRNCKRSSKNVSKCRKTNNCVDKRSS